MREARTEDPHPVAERIGDRFDHGTFIGADLDGLHLAEDRQVHQTLVHRTVHAVDQGDIVLRILIVGRIGGRPKPLSVLTDVEVVAPGGKAARVCREASV